MKPRVVVVSGDEKLVVGCKAALGSSCSVSCRVVQGSTTRELSEKLMVVVSEVVGESDGNIDTQCVILDASFQPKRGSPYVVCDNLYSDLPSPSGSALSVIVGAGIPVLVNLNSEDSRRGWEIGATGARLLNRDLEEVPDQVKEAVGYPKYNRHTLEVENEFAKVYDEEELAGAATVSAVLFENEYVLENVRDHVAQAVGKVRVLDLGCGTGRFEEILLTDKTIRDRIDLIVAVDFAPQYLLEAKKRLPHFLGDEEMSRIRFCRRIAEDLQLPGGYFDIVLASFGILCFSHSHYTLQEIHRVLKPGGRVLLNGYNRDALTYDFDQLHGIANKPVTHFAIHIDREENLMYLGDGTIHCMTFSTDSLQSLLQIVGLHPAPQTIRTFPTLYGSARRDYLKEIGARSRNGKKTHPSCRHVGPCVGHASYQEVNLAARCEKSGFNEIVHKMDADLERVLPGKGFYFCATAIKG